MPAECIDDEGVVGAMILYCINPANNIVNAQITNVRANGNVDLEYGITPSHVVETNVAWAATATADRWHCIVESETEMEANGWRTLSTKRAKTSHE